MRALNLLPMMVVSIVASSASAQSSLRARLVPITAPVRNAGVYHVSTGTWTRNASLASVTGPDTIYNNTCAGIYFARMQLGDQFQHSSRIPSTSSPTIDSAYYSSSNPAHRYDSRPGCHDSYTVDGFEIEYCSSATSTVDWQYVFASIYSLCGGGDIVPQYTVVVTGLPGGTPSGAQQCWIVDVDVSGSSSGGLVLSADGNGTYPGGLFGFGFGPTNAITLGDFTGPIVAGDLAWTGGTLTGPLTPCTGTDGTIWDNPANLAEAGTGMSSNDYFRVTGASPSVPAGCYNFGGDPHADFYLKLQADAQCPPPNPLTSYCFPGEGTTRACTSCNPANPPSVHGRGCNNFGSSTGGAELTATGIAQVSGDTVVFTSQFENSTALTIIMQGTATTNVVFGAGIRCVAGTLKRLYIGPAGSVANGDPPGTFHRPGPSDPNSVHQASLNKGYDIGAHAPVALYYLAYYRDPSASSHCGGATFNSTQSGSLSWVP